MFAGDLIKDNAGCGCPSAANRLLYAKARPRVAKDATARHANQDAADLWNLHHGCRQLIVRHCRMWLPFRRQSRAFMQRLDHVRPRMLLLAMPPRMRLTLVQDYVCVHIFTYMRTEITCVCIYLHICTLRLRVCVYIYNYAPCHYVCVHIFTYMRTEITCVCIYLHICTLKLRVCVYIYNYAH